jgi:sialate O-acetylesterase
MEGFGVVQGTQKVVEKETLPNKTMLPRIPLILLSALLLPGLRAEVKPNPLFTDNAVLQQGIPVPVWGTASDGETVTVEFAGQKVSSMATNGSWMVRLQPMSASANPRSMTVTGSSTVTLTNIVVGEVWICSGQSNMERQLGLRKGQQPLVNWESEAATADHPGIRHFLVKQIMSTNPLSEVSGDWQVCTPTTVTNFTAVGYYFGRDLHKAIGVPVGLLHVSWGGTPAETWTRHEVLETNSQLSAILPRYANDVATYADRLAKYQADEPRLKEEYTNAMAKALAEAKPTPRPPSPPKDPLKTQNSPSRLFNGMLHPVIPYAMRGVIWYQGESNSGRAKEYRDLFPAMIADWRALWGEGNFPFLFVQLAPYRGTGPEIREAQLLTLAKSSNTAMVVTTDHGAANDIHPTEKEPVGQRLALAARALAYGERIEYSGPLFSQAGFHGTNVVVTFSHVGTGLVTKGGDLKGFEVAGSDGKFLPAHAVIDGLTVIATSPEVPVPAAVRYGWTNVPDGNLFNAAGLPASPFRSNPD